MKQISLTTFFCTGVFSIVLFHFDIFYPIWLSALIYIVISVYIYQKFTQKRVGILMLLLWLVYLLPFVHIFPYLWFDFDTASSDILWGMKIRPYMLEERIIKLTGMLGAVGGIGYALGLSFNLRKLGQYKSVKKHILPVNKETQSIVIWCIWILCAIILSWLASPTNNIFETAYAQTIAFSRAANFNSAWLMSYSFLAFAYCDWLFEANQQKKKLKLKILIVVITFIAIVLQLLRGDRAILPFIVMSFLLVIYWQNLFTKKKKISLPWRKIGVIVIIIFMVAKFVGVLRASLIDVKDYHSFILLLQTYYGLGKFDITNLLYGTWSAVLLTPLSVAGDYVYGIHQVRSGQDYVNLLLSVLPGFICDYFGYDRPIDAYHGPAWEMTYGQGGTHAVVLPFRNFLMTGVFVIPALWSYLLSKAERIFYLRPQAIGFTLIFMFAGFSAHWVWYGEKNAINAIIIWFILRYVYTFSIHLDAARRTIAVRS